MPPLDVRRTTWFSSATALNSKMHHRPPSSGPAYQRPFSAAALDRGVITDTSTAALDHGVVTDPQGLASRREAAAPYRLALRSSLAAARASAGRLTGRSVVRRPARALLLRSPHP
jgi:hypothetical protein